MKDFATAQLPDPFKAVESEKPYDEFDLDNDEVPLSLTSVLRSLL